MSRAKTTAVTVAAVFALYTAVSWQTGKSYQKHSEERIAAFNRDSSALIRQSLPFAGTFRLEQTDFDRGIYTSQARYLLHLSADGVPPVGLEAEINHGPLAGFRPVRYSVTYRLADVPQNAEYFAAAGGKNPFTYTVRRGWGKKIRHIFDARPLKFTAGSQSFDAAGLEIRAQTDRNLSFFSGSLKADKLSWQSADGTLLLADLHYRMDGRRVPGHAVQFAGEDEMRIGSVQSGKENPFSAKGIYLSSETRADKRNPQLFSQESTLRVKSLKSGKLDFGSLKGKTESKRLNHTLLGEISAASVSGNFHTAAAAAARLLQDNPHIAWKDWEWETPEGTLKFSAHAVARAPAADKPQLYAGDFFRQLEADADLPKAALHDIAAKIRQQGGMKRKEALRLAEADVRGFFAPVVKEGLLEEKGSRYRLKARLKKNAEIELNGQIFKRPLIAREDWQALIRPSGQNRFGIVPPYLGGEDEDFR